MLGRSGGNDSFAIEEFMRELTQRPQGKGRHMKEGGTVDGLSKGLGKFGVSDRPRCSGVERAAQVEIFDGKEGQHRFVFDVNPGHPLAPVPESAAERRAKEPG